MASLSQSWPRVEPPTCANSPRGVEGGKRSDTTAANGPYPRKRTPARGDGEWCPETGGLVLPAGKEGVKGQSARGTSGSCPWKLPKTTPRLEEASAADGASPTPVTCVRCLKQRDRKAGCCAEVRGPSSPGSCAVASARRQDTTRAAVARDPDPAAFDLELSLRPSNLVRRRHEFDTQLERRHCRSKEPVSNSPSLGRAPAQAAVCQAACPAAERLPTHSTSKGIVRGRHLDEDLMLGACRLPH